MPKTSQTENELSVGEVAERSGVAVSTLHYYETKGLIAANRSNGNQRRYPRSILRRVAIIRIAQRAGLSLAELREALSHLPTERAPSVEDFKRLSANWKNQLQRRIDALTQLRDDLQGCIGCGCLSTKECPLRNPDDEAGKRGSGAVFMKSE